MATLDETATFDAGVYQLETIDPVTGGSDGIANAPLKNLANRTSYLKEHIDSLESGDTIPPTVAPVDSPVFTGDPRAPTAALGDNDTSLATTKFVQGTVGGRLVKSVAGEVNVTLTAVEAGNAIIECTGVITANIALIVPTSPTRSWIVFNNTTGAFTLTVKTPAGTGIVISQGRRAIFYNDATNIVAVDGGFVAGTRMPFAQSTAPTGWTQDTSDNADNRMLRVVKTAGNGAGGSHSPILNSVVPSHTHGFTTGAVSADHVHGVSDPGHAHSMPAQLAAATTTSGGLGGTMTSQNNGTWATLAALTGISLGGISANHTHSGSTDGGSSATNWAPRYIDMIICTKD